MNAVSDKIHDLTILALQKSTKLGSDPTPKELVELYNETYALIEQVFESSEPNPRYSSVRPQNW
jgi:hypothetical protein